MTSKPKPRRVDSRWNGESGDTLRQALRPPVTNCVEQGLGGCELERGNGDRLVEQLMLTVKTSSAYRIPVAKVFVEALTRRTKLQPDLVTRVHTAVQEALMNAVLHGNLKIDASLRGNLDDLFRMHEAIEARLSVAEASRAPVRVEAIWNDRIVRVLIRDAGDGYAAVSGRECADRQLTGDRSAGRGLAILNVMCDEFSVVEDGRVARMSFSR